MRTTTRAICSLLAVALATVLALAPGSAAVDAKDRVVVDFEGGQDRAPVRVSGATFTNDNGGDWLYGDVRTRKYNAPYPQSCADRPGGLATPRCDYAASGNIFVWSGFIGRSSRITFTDRSASFFQTEVSTGTDLTFIALGGDGNAVDAAVVPANNGTGRLDRVRLEAPSGSSIASIVITGQANFWLLDAITSDAFTVAADPARVTLAARPTLADATMIYTLVATNRGRGAARNAMIVLPFDPARLRLIDAAFSREGAWVSQVLSNTVELQTGPLASGGDTVTATLRLAVLQPFAPGDALSNPATVTWRSAGGGGTGRANRPVLSDTGLYRLAVTPQPGGFSVSSDLFLPNEPVGVWLNLAGGTVQALGTPQADANGAVAQELSSAGLAPGFYSAVARGTWSGITAVGVFEVR